MHIDSSRSRFDPAKHYSGVLALQGRVTLDSDLTEQQAILLHHLRTTVADIIGPAGVPKASPGFGITRSETPDNRPDLTVSAGRLYVDGILVENTEEATYWEQPQGRLDLDDDVLPAGTDYLVYLRVWERAVTAIQDPDLREVALGIHGPDTTARSQVVWQVSVHAFGPDGPGDAAVDIWRTWLDGLWHPGPMQAQARRPDEAEIDVCSVAPEAMFRGQENQHYRVEVFHSGQARPEEEPHPSRRRGPVARPPGTARFVWSRDNGSDVYAVSALDGAEVTLTDLGRDRRTSLDQGDLVELVDDRSAAPSVQEDAARPVRTLFEVVAVDALHCVVTLDRDPGVEMGEVGTEPELHPMLRRWDAAPADVTEGRWLPLEDGVEVRFPGGTSAKIPATYRSGDYWLVPARRTIGDVIWPRDDDGPAALPPSGVRYHYAPLALVPASPDTEPTDLRSVFEPATT